MDRYYYHIYMYIYVYNVLYNNITPRIYSSMRKIHNYKCYIKYNILLYYDNIYISLY